MRITPSTRYVFRFVVAVCGVGTLMASSCSLRQLEAISVGLDAATGHLDQADSDDDISFGDWLRDELRDI